MRLLPVNIGPFRPYRIYMNDIQDLDKSELPAIRMEILIYCFWISIKTFNIDNTVSPNPSHKNIDKSAYCECINDCFEIITFGTYSKNLD